jgi:phosphomannomutase
MALILHLIAQKNQTVGELIGTFPRYAIVKEKLVCPSNKLTPVLKMLRQEYDAFPMDTRDGVKVTLPNGWFLVRGSNTEPVVRVVAEAKNQDEAKDLVFGVRKKIEAFIERV